MVSSTAPSRFRTLKRENNEHAPDYNKIAPGGVKALGGLYGYVMQSGLSAELVELVYLRISQINNCAYCLDMHTRNLIKKGVKIEKLALLQAWAEAGHLFSERERAALAWAETVTRVSETGVPDEAFEAARAVFQEKELVDLTIAIGLMNAYNRMAISFRSTPQAALESSGHRRMSGIKAPQINRSECESASSNRSSP